MCALKKKGAEQRCSRGTVSRDAYGWIVRTRRIKLQAGKMRPMGRGHEGAEQESNQSRGADRRVDCVEADGREPWEGF